jgi:hypothetical protein
VHPLVEHEPFESGLRFSCPPDNFLKDWSHHQQWHRATRVKCLASGAIYTAKPRYDAEAKQHAKQSKSSLLIEENNDIREIKPFHFD